MENLIEVIKAYRNQTGASLADAAHAIQDYEKGNTTNKTTIEEIIKQVKSDELVRQAETSSRVVITVTHSKLTHQELRQFILRKLTLESQLMKATGVAPHISVN